MPTVTPAFMAVGLHLLNGGLLYGVATGLGLPRRAALYSALIYLTFFAHFHAVLDSGANQYLQGVFWLLLLALCFRVLPRRVLSWSCLLFLIFALFKGGFTLWIPFLTMVSSFLQPIEAALRMDPARANYPVPPQTALWAFLISAGLAARLWISWRAGSKALPALLIWYLFCALFFLKKAAGFPRELSSLAFIFISPIFAIAFAETLESFAVRVRRPGRIALAGIAAVLCLSNLLAIPVALFRGRLVNHISVYGELRSARANTFDRLFEQGVSRLRQGREPEALDLFRQAAAARPFLLQYLLGSCRLSDLRWIAAPLDLRGYLRRLIEEQGNLPAVAVIQREAADYAFCLFALSALEARAGRLESSRAWFSQIRYLERDPDRLAAWIGQLPQVQGDPSLMEFAAHLADPGPLQDPLPWRKDDYGFGRFLVRLLTRRDFQSAWDRQVGVRI